MVQAEVADRLAAAARLQGVRHPVGQGRVVRRRPPRRRDRPQRLLAGAQRRLRPGRLDPPRPAAPRPSTREQVFAVVDAAFAHRRKALRGVLRALAGSGEAAEAALRRGGRRPAGPRRVARRRRVRPDRRGAAAVSALPQEEREVTVRAAAKINLHLGVGAARADGFHPLVTVYQAISLYDDLVARHGRRDRGSDAVSYVDLSTRAAATTPTSPLRADPVLGRAAPIVGSAPTCTSTRRSPSPAAWPADRPTPPPPWSPLDRLWDLSTTTTPCCAAARGLGSDVPVRAARRHRARHRPRRARDAGAGRRRPGAGWSSRRPDGHLSTPEVYRHCDVLHPDAADARARRRRCSPRSRTGDPAALAARPPQRPPGGRPRPAPRPRDPASSAARPRARCAAWSPAPDRPASSSASPATTPARSPGGLRAAGHDPVLVGVRPGRRRARAWTTPDGQPGQPRAGLQVLRRPAAAHRRLARHRRRASGSASSAATATARPRCWR